MSTISCQQRQFGTLETGQTITCYSLRNTSGMTVSLLDYGAILNAVQVPDSRGDMNEITLGPSQVTDLQAPMPSGSTLVHLPARYGITFNNVLNKTIWDAENVTQDKAASVRLSCQGMLDLKYSVTKLEYKCTTEYTLTATDELIIRSQIQTSLPLPAFMTHHPIWNLTGGSIGEVSDHVLQVFSSHYSKLDEAGLSDLEFSDTANQPAFNFTQPQRIGEKYSQIDDKKDYNVCFQLKKQTDAATKTPLAAYVKAPVSGRTLEIYTDQPALRFYLKSNDENALEGFCLSPMSLLNQTASPASNTHTIQQETHYKLIW